MSLAIAVLPFLIAERLFEHLDDICGYIYQRMVLQ
jgi:hypothetical protein